jgi:hypothetical protein
MTLTSYSHMNCYIVITDRHKFNTNWPTRTILLLYQASKKITSTPPHSFHQPNPPQHREQAPTYDVTYTWFDTPTHQPPPPSHHTLTRPCCKHTSTHHFPYPTLHHYILCSTLHKYFPRTCTLYYFCTSVILLWALGIPQCIVQSLEGSTPRGPEDDSLESKHVAPLSHY